MDLVRLHHVNFSSRVVPEMDGFYREVLGLDPVADDRASTRLGGYTAPVSFLRSGDVELHLAGVDLDAGFRHQQAINPLVSGHLAFRTSDLAAVKRRLEAKGINFSDYGVWSIANWHQIFFMDPAGNVIEVHQVLDGG
jgi:glyoxylase I family protein